ncbi:response regulator transcription factor [Nocardioides sp. SYSU DS0663]|uniref:response regulator transcription factor n=1 Tax=Nocardioides sp. SYSU DS0663 TaxID=3416445 RepID=UPI003F4B361C
MADTVAGAPHRALVVDDDPDICELIVTVLAGAGIEVTTASSGAEAVASARREPPDLITLDLTLPDMDGTEVCRSIRTFSDAYVIMITGRDSEIDRLVGLEMGADDYLAKPFSPRELRARAAALLRRPRVAESAPGAGGAEESVPGSAETPRRPAEPEVHAGGGLVLVPVDHLALLDGEPLPLTPAELALLTSLAAAPGRTWERGDLVREVWQGEFIESDFLVDVHVANLRRKLRKAGGGARDWIRTVGGVGYAFEPPASG